ncbi:aldose 1-epimerase [Congregibacter variabilis]|uniref:Aldose 1-epimerase n=1 Tax=Congregibacter variabilis TaxID=3081200 RepID=A0ABZ0I076_9GAMM|nr:aldose 1-epimerase [Congregibacter sp. IMCC43200]
MNTVWLEHAGVRVEIAPEAGAALLSLQSLHHGKYHDWLVDKALAETIGVPACFPLIPFANRIAEGKLAHGGHALAANRPDLSAHPIHGYAWQAPWNVDSLQSDALKLSYDGRHDAWPWQYRAQLNCVIAPKELRMHLKLTHVGPGQMPAGLGLHPAFPSAGLLSVQGRAGAFLPVDRTGLPRAYTSKAPECEALATGQLPDLGIDNDFDGWQQQLLLRWPDRQLELLADPVFSALHVFRPTDKPLICVEPVTHLTAAMAYRRLPEVPAPTLLGPGESLEGSIVFRLLEPS